VFFWSSLPLWGPVRWGLERVKKSHQFPIIPVLNKGKMRGLVGTDGDSAARRKAMTGQKFAAILRGNRKKPLQASENLSIRWLRVRVPSPSLK
jgi:hypothetical protein